MTAILDSSALLAVAMDEPGGDMVAAALEDAAISTANLAEFVEVIERRGLNWADVSDVVTISSVAIAPLDIDDAVVAGQMAKTTRVAGLSLGDRCCLALAKRKDAEVLTADRAWEQFAKPLGIKIRLIR